MKLSKILHLMWMVPAAFIFSCQAQNSGGVNPLPNFDVMWDYNNPAETEEIFSAILKGLKNNAESSYDQNYHVELLTQIARTQGLQGMFDEANKTLNEAEQLLTDNTRTGKIRYLIELGRVNLSSGDPQKAKDIFLQAHDYGLDNNLDYYLMDTIHMLGIIGTPKEQIEWNLVALELAEKTEDLRAKTWLGPLYNNIGWSYHDSGDYAVALEYFQKGYEFRQTQADENATRIAKWAVARAMRSLERYDEALMIQLELEQEIEAQNLPKDGYVYQELAEIYLVQNNPESKKYFKLAYDVLSQDNWVVENHSDTLKRMKKLSE